MPINKGEKAFERFIKERDGLVYRFKDTADFKRAGAVGGGMSSNNPADYVAMMNGYTFLAEVKTTSKEKFVRSQVLNKKFQGQAAEMVTRKGYLYMFALYIEPLGRIWLVNYNKIKESGGSLGPEELDSICMYKQEIKI